MSRIHPHSAQFNIPVTKEIKEQNFSSRSDSRNCDKNRNFADRGYRYAEKDFHARVVVIKLFFRWKILAEQMRR